MTKIKFIRRKRTIWGSIENSVMNNESLHLAIANYKPTRMVTKFRALISRLAILSWASHDEKRLLISLMHRLMKNRRVIFPQPANILRTSSALECQLRKKQQEILKDLSKVWAPGKKPKNLARVAIRVSLKYQLEQPRVTSPVPYRACTLI